MNSRFVKFILPSVLLSAVICLSGALLDRAFAGKKFPASLTILFTGDDLGNIKTCG